MGWVPGIKLNVIFFTATSTDIRKCYDWLTFIETYLDEIYGLFLQNQSDGYHQDFLVSSSEDMNYEELLSNHATSNQFMYAFMYYVFNI